MRKIERKRVKIIFEDLGLEKISFCNSKRYPSKVNQLHGKEIKYHIFVADKLSKPSTNQ